VQGQGGGCDGCVLEYQYTMSGHVAVKRGRVRGPAALSLTHMASSAGGGAVAGPSPQGRALHAFSISLVLCGVLYFRVLGLGFRGCRPYNGGNKQGGGAWWRQWRTGAILLNHQGRRVRPSGGGGSGRCTGAL
jgi:hypothetical protein